MPCLQVSSRLGIEWQQCLGVLDMGFGRIMEGEETEVEACRLPSVCRLSDETRDINSFCRDMATRLPGQRVPAPLAYFW